ncbi:MAG: Chemotaxis phosphatase, CheZ [Acidobacteria bacterium ADurb.Bin340]|nr:MAG: Chemotaxis phosphatase, CheZ [Acidobacteria bacterium ADurb.Bin340]HOD32375.1 protein phosphatase CheZ [Holophaga sp.]
MESQESQPSASAPVEPDSLLKEFRERSEMLDARLDALGDMLKAIRLEIHDEGQRALTRLAQAASDMANGRVYQKIDIEAKGELGALVESLNTTLENLQQLDASVKEQSTQVPELAAQLDAITVDTETATQSVMNRLDALMAASDAAGRELDQSVSALKENQEAQTRFQARIDGFLDRASGGEDPTRVAQEVLDFLFEHQMTTRLPPVDLAQVQAQLRQVSDESFEILNTLQFQDITRQKVEKVVQLLKQFQGGLRRLLEIFKIEAAEAGAATVFEHRAIATQDRIFETSLVQDQKKESVDDIIAQFKKTQG